MRFSKLFHFDRHAIWHWAFKMSVYYFFIFIFILVIVIVTLRMSLSLMAISVFGTQGYKFFIRQNNIWHGILIIFMENN